MFDRRDRLRQNVALDRRRKLEVVLHGLLFERLAVETRVFQRNADLIREQRQQSQLVRLERPDSAVARFAIGGGEHADDLIVPIHRHRNDRSFLETDRIRHIEHALQIRFGHRNITE